jgi:hypothetical protein
VNNKKLICAIITSIFNALKISEIQAEQREVDRRVVNHGVNCFFSFNL